MTSSRHLVENVRREIESVGGAIDRERLNRRCVIYWSIGERKFVTIVPKASRSLRAVTNQITAIRRHARGAHHVTA